MALVLPAIMCQGLGFGCDTHAVGVSDCREIEKARCAAAHSCGFRVDSNTTEAECERFSRDNCLHGLPRQSPPEASELSNCLKAIRAASACAEDKDKGATYLATSCTSIGGITLATATVCDIIEGPEQATSCSFLLAEPKPAVIVDSGSPAPVDAGSD
jgi:hypothetical protein